MSGAKPSASIEGASRHGKTSLQPEGRAPGPGTKNVVNPDMRALADVRTRLPAATLGWKPGLDGLPAGVPLPSLLLLLTIDPGRCPMDRPMSIGCSYRRRLIRTC